MASNVDFILNLDGTQARKVLLDLYNRGNNLFSKEGYKLKLDSRGFNRSLDQATDRVLSFTAATTVLASVGLAMRRLASDASLVETAVAKIQSILNLTQSDLSKFTSSIFDLANKTGTAFTDAAVAAEEFSRQGLSVEKTLKATEAALSLARVSGGNLAKTVQDLVAITSAFGNEALVYEEVADKLGALDAAFSTTTTGLAEGLARVASIANDVGVSFEEMSSLIAATKQVTGRSEAVIGNAFKSIFTNIGTESVQKELRAIGVETKNLDGTFIDAEKVLLNLSKAYETLTDAQQANITFKVAGKYNKNVLQGAIFAQNQGVTDKALQVAGDSSGSIAKRLQVLNETTATSIQRLQNAITELGSTNLGGIFNSLTKDFASYTTDAAKSLGEIFAKENPIGKALSNGIIGALKGPVFVLGSALIISLVRKILTDLNKAARSVFNTTGGFETQKTVLKQITQELQKQNALLGQRTSLANAGAAAMGGAGKTLNPKYLYPDGSFRPNNSPITRPLRSDPKYTPQRDINSSYLPENYLKDRQIYNAQVARRGAQNTRARGLYDSQQSAAKQQAAEKAMLAKAARSERIREGGFKASFGASILGSAAGSLVGGSEGKVTSSVGQGLASAAIGASFGPVGLAVGSVVGAFQILTTATQELFGNFEEINQKTADNIIRLQKEGEAGDAYVQAQINYNEALKGGESALIEKARNDLTSSAKGLRGDFVGLLSEIDPAKLTKLNEAFKTSSEGVQAAMLAMIEANKAVENSYSGLFDKISFLSGGKVNLTKETGSGVARLIADSIGDTSKISGDISRLQGGSANEAETFIRGLIKGSKEASTAFYKVAEGFEGGSQDLSVFVLEMLAAKDIQSKFNDSQEKLIKTTNGLNVSFSKTTAKLFAGAGENQKDSFSRLRSRLNASSILARPGNEIQEVENSFSSGLAELSVSMGESVQGAIQDFKENLGKDILGSSQGSKLTDVAKFLEGFAKSSYDLKNLEKDLTSLKVNPGEIKQSKDALEDLGEKIKAIGRESGRSAESLKTEFEARLKVARRNESLNRFGDIDSDQSKDISAIAAGKKALDTFRSRRSKEGSKAKLSVAEADLVRKGAASAKNIGRTGEFSLEDLDLANTVKTQSVASAQASSSIGSAFSSLFGNKSTVRNPNAKFADQKIAKDIEKLVAKGDFPGAQKLVSGLSLGSQEKGFISSKLSDEAARYGEARKTGGLMAEDQIAKNTGDTVAALNNILSALKLTEGVPVFGQTSLEDKVRMAEGSSRIKDLNTELSSEQLKLKEIRELKLQEQSEMSTVDSVLRSATVSKPGGTSPLQERALRERTWSDLAEEAMVGGFSDKVEGSAITPGEAKVIKDAYSYSGSKFSKDQMLKQGLSPERYQQISSGVGKMLPKLDAGLSLPELNRQERNTEVAIYDKEKEKKAAEDSQKRLEAASKSIETSATLFKTSADIISQGSTSKTSADIAVDVSGAAFATNPDAMEKIRALFRTLFVEHLKEVNGVEPQLAPK